MAKPNDITDKITDLLSHTTPICDGYKEFVYESSKQAMRLNVTDKQVYEKCGKVLKKLKRKKIVPESQVQKFMRLYVNYRQTAI